MERLPIFARRSSEITPPACGPVAMERAIGAPRKAEIPEVAVRRRAAENMIIWIMDGWVEMRLDEMRLLVLRLVFLDEASY